MIDRRRRVRRDEDIYTTPLWLATYSDMVTQLLAFFVLIVALSSMDVAKFHQANLSIKSAFGLLPSGRSILYEEGLNTAGDEEAGRSPFERDWEQLMSVGERVRGAVAKAGLTGQVDLAVEERGLVIRFADRVLFDSGKALLKSDARVILDSVGEILKNIPNLIRVEGHTDNVPINTERYPSNWELSTARATVVVRYFIERGFLPPGRLSAAGYGEFKPVASNENEEGRRRNRRVDVVILHLSQVSNEPAEAAGQRR